MSALAMSCALAVGFVFATTGAMTQTVTLVRNGKSAYAIMIVPGSGKPDSRPAREHGAKELQKFIKEISGAELPILAPEAGWNDLDKGIRGLITIVDDRIPAEREHRSPLGEEEFRIRSYRARSPVTLPVIEISGGGKRGALYGCYAFLEDVLGCRWYTAKISRIPRKRTIVFQPLNIHQKPAFEYREPYYWESFDKDWAVRNRTNGNAQHLDESVGGRVSYGRFVHTFNELVPPEKYFDAHPEYFSLINGKRMKGYYQLCLTNPDVLRISIAKVREWIHERPDATIFSVSQNDTYNNCQCDNCKAVEKEEGAPSGTVLRFVNALAAAIEKEHPNVLIDTLAYQWTEDPPKHARPRPNVRIRLAPIGACVAHGFDKCDANTKVLANLQAWAKITNQLYIWHYSTNFANYLQPLPDLDEISQDIGLFKKLGVVGLFYEGAYASGGGGEMSELKAYLMAKLMWNPSRPAEPIISEFLEGVYGKAAPLIRQWLDLLHAPERDRAVHAKIYDPPSAAYLDVALLRKGKDLFDAAERAAAGDPMSLDSVQRARLALEYVQLMQLKPENAARPVLAGTVADKIRKYGIGEVREGQPASVFLTQIGK
jgi:hypothetical protein